jgi:DNA repair protein RadA/Sms
MKDSGLVEILNPSQVFLNERAEAVSGSVITAVLEGTRPLLVEVQALVTPTKIAIPRRVTTGVDYNRVAMIIAVLEKRLNLQLYMSDIYLNLAGGIKVTEPALDLAVAVAITSCFKNKVVDGHTLYIGEIGLGGEVRAVNQVSARVNEAKNLGFKKVVVPAFNKEELKTVKGIEIQYVTSLKEAFV